MIEICHKYSLTSEWLHDIVGQLGEGAKVINEKLVLMPEFAEGGVFFTEVTLNKVVEE